jgi:NADH-quinone oxidoreductase subunit N
MKELLLLMKSELMITVIIFILLLIKLGKGIQHATLLSLVQVLLLVSIGIALVENRSGSLFDGMFQGGSLVGYQKAILGLAVYLITLLFSGWLKKSDHLTEFLVLMLSSLLGMYFMISSGNLLMFYLSLELTTIPVAAMANFDLEKKKSAEAAMKMILSSAFSSGILLFGISLVYGTTGTIDFAKLTQIVNGDSLQVLAFIFLFSAFAFKLSIVPFHLWTADVYEGSPMAVTSFLSVVSKGSIAFIFITVLYKVFQSMEEVWYILLVILAIATMVIGNLFALRQDNIKRFLAFSSIAQVGFILVGMSGNTDAGFSAVTYFVLVYVFSNLAAFGVAAVLSDEAGMENISAYRGLIKSNPLLAWMMALALFSLAGIPPTAGFFGKMFLLSAGAVKGNYWFIIVAALNMIISLYYYLKVVRVMFMEEPMPGSEKIRIEQPVKFALIICVSGIVLAGVFSWIYDYITKLA